MKHFIPLALIAVFLASCQPQENTGQPDASFPQYTNAEYGISFSYPRGWEEEEKENSEQGLRVQFTSPTAIKNGANAPIISLVAVQSGPIPESVTMDMLEERALAPTYESNPSIKFIKRYDTTLAGVPTRISQHSAIDTDGDTLRMLHALFYAHERLYVMILIAPENEYEDTMNAYDTMLSSIQIQ